jgi:HAE1 family hydrophobic/amphiphilic exporter-1
MSLPDFSTRYPVTIGMMTLAVVLLGWISLERLGVDLLPDLQSRVITVDVRSPGKTPREMEERYARRLEGDIGTVRKVRRVHSVSRSGQAVVVAEFEWDADMDFALLDVQKKVGRYASDSEVEVLDVTQEDPQALPVMRVAVSSEDSGVDLDDLYGTVETLVKPKLESLIGVSSAEIEGGAEKEVRVILDAYLLEAYGLTPETIANRIQEANTDISGGTLKDGQQAYLVKGLGRLVSMEDVRELVVGERRGVTATGQPDPTSPRVPVTVGDVGKVVLKYEDRETLVRLDGPECMGLAVYREAGANTANVVRSVMKVLGDMERDLGHVRFTVVENQARFVEQAVSEVEESAIIGALLAVGVLLLVLRSWTTTVVIVIAIPISVLATFTLMYFEGLTLNVMTLGGLALGAGMLVDNAIVVIENIHRHLEQGSDVRTAAAQGATEVGVPILASTLTTVSVFLPIVYLQGLAGELFKEQAWTVAFSLISSLGVAMTTVPMLASRMLRKARRPVSGVRSPFFVSMLTGVLNHKGTVALVLIGCLGVAYSLVGSIQTEFIPREDQGLFQVDLSLPEGTRLEVTDRVARRVGAITAAACGDEIEHIYVRVGTDPARVFGAGEPTGPNRATLSAILIQDENRRTVPELVAALDPELREIPELKVNYRLHETALEGVMGSDEAPLQVEVSGENLDLLRDLTNELQSRISALPEVYNLRTSFQGGQPEVDLALHSAVVSAFGMTTQTIVSDLKRRLSGEVAGELSKDQRARTIRVGFEDVNLQELEEIRVDGPDGALLRLGDIAELNVISGPREILRNGQRRVGRISGNLIEGAALSQATDRVYQIIRNMAIPHGYRVEIVGEERQRAESFGGLQFALILSVILVYMVMASLFESLLHPFTVMLTVPLAGIGVVLAFWGLGEPFSVMAFIGMIMLGGIAVNDAIILVDRINQIKRDAKSIREAVLKATQDRLRPILMTSATTILALLPMAFGVGEGARLRAPMAIAVIGGLFTSTLMTLVIIPVVYEWIDRLRGSARP